MTRDIIRDIHTQTGITATAGIGTNMYLAKVAMDIVAKHIQAGRTAFASPGLTRCRTGDCCGITGRLPISGVWGVDMQGSSKRTDWRPWGYRSLFHWPCRRILQRRSTVQDVRCERRTAHRPCVGLGTVHHRGHQSVQAGGAQLEFRTSADRPAGFDAARLIVREMADTLSLDLVAKGVKAGRVGLMVGYDTASLDPKRLGKDGSADLKRLPNMPWQHTTALFRSTGMAAAYPSRPPGRSHCRSDVGYVAYLRRGR